MRGKGGDPSPSWLGLIQALPTLSLQNHVGLPTTPEHRGQGKENWNKVKQMSKRKTLVSDPNPKAWKLWNLLRPF